MPEIRSWGAEQIRWDLNKETLGAAGDALEEELRASRHSQGAGIRPEVFSAAFDTSGGECTQEDHLGWVLPRSALGSFTRG